MKRSKWIYPIVTLSFCGLLTTECKKEPKPDVEQIPEGSRITNMTKVQSDGSDNSSYILEYDNKGRLTKWGMKSDGSNLPQEELNEEDRIFTLDRVGQQWTLDYTVSGCVTIECDTYTEAKGGNFFQYKYTIIDGKVVSMTGTTNHRKAGATVTTWEETFSAKATYEGEHLVQWVLNGVDVKDKNYTYTLTTTLTWEGDNCTRIHYDGDYPNFPEAGDYTFSQSDVTNDLNFDWMSISTIGLQVDQSLQVAQLFGFTGAFTKFIPTDVRIKKSQGDDDGVDDDDVEEEHYTVTATDDKISRLNEDDGSGFEIEYKK